MFHLKKERKSNHPPTGAKSILRLWMEMAVGLRRAATRVFGHKGPGMEALQNVTIAAKEMGVQVLTVYAFQQKTGLDQKRSQNLS